MKNFFLGLVLFGACSIQAQSINDFKYVIIPDTFTGFDQNQYRLNYLLMRMMEDKKYVVLKSDHSDWPQEVIQNSCLALNADVIKGKLFLKNKVELTFTDCQGKEMGRFEGISSEKEYLKGYQEALKNAIQYVKLSFPKELDYKAKPMEKATNTQTVQIDVNGNVSEKNIIENGIEFKNGKQILILTGMKDGSYLLIQKENSAIIAQMKPSSREGIYHVSVIDPNGNYSTIGFYDQKTLGIEFKNPEGKFVLTEFKK